MIDWGYRGTKHQEISFGHYAEYVNFALGSMENEAPFVLGYCTGGIIALIWASLFPQKPKDLVLMATPVDFTDWRDPRMFLARIEGGSCIAIPRRPITQSKNIILKPIAAELYRNPINACS